MHIKVQGIVQDGIGDASYWIAKFQTAYKDWTGSEIYPGLLNVQLEQRFDWGDPKLVTLKKIYSLAPYGGNRDIILMPCMISSTNIVGIPGFVWATTNAANDVQYKTLELISSNRLRDTLDVKNGELVIVDIIAP